MKARSCAFATWDGETAYFFRGAEYVRYDLRAKSVDEGYPMAIADGWEGVWPDGIDAALVTDARTVYFFRGAEYVRYDLEADRVEDGYPMAIADGWEGVWPDGVDAAFARDDSVAYFFKGPEYVRYDLDEDRAEDGYPMTVAEGWSGVWERGVDAAMRVGRKAHFFLEGLHVRFDLPRDRADRGYTLPAARAFPGVWSADEAPDAPAPDDVDRDAFAEVLARFERFAQEDQGVAAVGPIFFTEDPAPALRARCEELGRRFTDPEFPAGPAAICSRIDDDADYNESLREIARRCEWLRPDELVARAGAGAPVLFDDAGAAAGDLEQGDTGDCWLLGAFSALAERHPDHLREHVFTRDSLDPWGVCSVRLTVDGREGYLVIDDRIPWDPSGERPAFVRSTAKRELWPLLLEKAFAKWAGCWQQLRGGLQGHEVPLGDDAVSALAGGTEVRSIDWRDRNDDAYVRADEVWDVLASWHAEGGIVTVGCASGEHGLVSDHVYTFLRLIEVTHEGAPQRFVCLRNPWASGEWKGDWGDRSKRWKADPLAALLAASGVVHPAERSRDDGVFVMAWGDFVARFEDAYAVTVERARAARG